MKSCSLAFCDQATAFRLSSAEGPVAAGAATATGAAGAAAVGECGVEAQPASTRAAASAAGTNFIMETPFVTGNVARGPAIVRGVYDSVTTGRTPLAHRPRVLTDCGLIHDEVFHGRRQLPYPHHPPRQLHRDGARPVPRAVPASAPGPARRPAGVRGGGVRGAVDGTAFVRRPRPRARRGPGRHRRGRVADLAHPRRYQLLPQ